MFALDACFRITGDHSGTPALHSFAMRGLQGTATRGSGRDGTGAAWNGGCALNQSTLGFWFMAESSGNRKQENLFIFLPSKHQYHDKAAFRRVEVASRTVFKGDVGKFAGSELLEIVPTKDVLVALDGPRLQARVGKLPKDSRSIFDRSVGPDIAPQRRWYMPSTLHRMIVSLY